MRLSGILAGLVVVLLFYGTLPLVALSAIGGSIFLLLTLSHHHHESSLAIDQAAQYAPLSTVNPLLKIAVFALLMVLTITHQSITFGCIMTLVMLWFTTCINRVSFSHYMTLLSLPLVFLLTSALALLFSYSPEPFGLLDIPFWGGYLSVTSDTQVLTQHVLSRSLGCISCLYALALSTPMADIISTLGKLKVPSVILQLMYLIYRYIFLLLSMHHKMKDAALSRLGYGTPATAWRTTALIYANLLGRSYRQATLCFDAMESRGFNGQITFHTTHMPISHGQIFFSLFLTSGMSILWLLLH